MRTLPFLLGLTLLSGCQSKGAAAEERYRMVERNHADASELCREAAVVAQAYLDDGDEVQYQRWTSEKRNQCVRAQVEL